MPLRPVRVVANRVYDYEERQNVVKLKKQQVSIRNKMNIDGASVRKWFVHSLIVHFNSNFMRV